MKRLLRTARLGLLLSAFIGLNGCFAARTWVPINQDHAPNSRRVLILKSADNPVYGPVESAFTAQVDDVANVYGYDLDQGIFNLRRSIQRLHPDVILALGTRATEFATQQLPETPLVFSMVVDYRRLDTIRPDAAAGVAMEVSPATEFSQFKLLLPNMRRVLAFYVPSEAGELVTDARARLKALGIELVAVPVRTAEEIPNRLEAALAGVDAIWILDDPILLNSTTFETLRQAALTHKLPLVASLSDQFARAGALASLSVDLPTIGFQASALARQILQGAKPAELGVQSPIGSKLVVNQATARAIGVKIPADALPLLELVGEP